MLACVSWPGFHGISWTESCGWNLEPLQSRLPLLFALHVQTGHLPSLSSGGLEVHTSVLTLPPYLWGLSASLWSVVCSRCY